ncbi:zinc finger, CCHC-type containing protein [Tanacetum coccineum]
MEVHLALTQATQVNKVTTSCEICSGPHDTQYCMEDPEQAFVEYASLRTDEVGGGLLAGIHGLFSGRNCCLFRRITCGYLPELEGKGFGSISTWEDLTTRFLAQFFLPGRTAKLLNDILMFQQHQGESLSEAWTRFKDLLQKVPHHGLDLWLRVQIFYDHVDYTTQCHLTMHKQELRKIKGQRLRETIEV